MTTTAIPPTAANMVADALAAKAAAVTAERLALYRRLVKTAAEQPNLKPTAKDLAAVADAMEGLGLDGDTFKKDVTVYQRWLQLKQLADTAMAELPKAEEEFRAAQQRLADADAEQKAAVEAHRAAYGRMDGCADMPRQFNQHEWVNPRLFGVWPPPPRTAELPPPPVPPVSPPPAPLPPRVGHSQWPERDRELARQYEETHGLGPTDADREREQAEMDRRRKFLEEKHRISRSVTSCEMVPSNPLPPPILSS